MPHKVGSGLSAKGSSGTSGLRSSAILAAKVGSIGGKVGVGKGVSMAGALVDSGMNVDSAVFSVEAVQAARSMVDIAIITQ